MKTKRFLSMLLALCLAVGMVFAAGVSVQAADPIGYVAMSVDVVVLGDGLLYGPEMVPFYAGDTYLTVTERFLNKLPTDDNIHGTDFDSYAIRLPRAIAGVPSIPPVILAAIAQDNGGATTAGDFVGRHDFASASAGWMLTVNNALSAASVTPTNDAVVRWQFSLYNGRDLGFDASLTDAAIVPLVNKDALTYAVAQVNSAPNVDLLKADLAVNPAYTSALSLLAQLTPSQIGINTAVTTLSSVALTVAKNLRKDAIDAVDDSLTQADYTPASWAALQTAMTNARNAVNAADTIAKVNAVAPPTTSGLETPAALTAAKDAKLATFNLVTAGLTAADYTPESWAALQDAVTAARNAVNAAPSIAAVAAVVVPSTSVLVTIAAGIAAARTARIALINAVTTGLTAADYTTESWAALQAAITNAINAVYAATTVAAVNAVPVPSTGGLVTKLTAAKTAKLALINAVTAGLNAADYTTASWTALQTALTTARNAVNAATTIAAVDAVVVPSKSILVATEAALTAAKIAKITAILAVDDGLEAADYTAESWLALQTAMANAIAAVEAAKTLAEIEAVAVPSTSILEEKTELTLLERWEAKLPQWLSRIPALPDWLEWIIMIGIFGWIW